VSGNKIIQSFHEFGPIIGERLEKAYNSPADIDLFVGGLLEIAEEDAVVGPTFREIIADQFSRLKRGDRYFYENSAHINPGHFNEKQLQEIKKANLARIICDNSDGIALHTQSPRAFIQSNLEGNEPVECKANILPSIDLAAWKA
jgi:peroxidase